MRCTKYVDFGTRDPLMREPCMTLQACTEGRVAGGGGGGGVGAW